MAEPEWPMMGKWCLVTGATSGIGRAIATGLARSGAGVVVVGRNPERCRTAVESIRRETGNPSVEFIAADLSSQAEVRRVAREFLDRHDRLHVLVNNAGALFALRRENVDGVEMTLALNHLACFLLTDLLLETLKASAPARIINLSSSAHDDVTGFDFNDPQARSRDRRYGRSEFASMLYCLTTPWKHPGVVQYAHSKLANLLFNYELARRLQGSGVTVNAVHPGLVASGFATGNGALGWFARFWSSLLGVRVEEGAKTPLYLACSPDVECVTGRYFVKRAPVPSSAGSMDEAAALRLWRLSEKLTSGSIDPA